MWAGRSIVWGQREREGGRERVEHAQTNQRER